MTAIRALTIIDEQSRHRAAFEAFCRSLAPEELATPVPGTPWSVHGYVAHLATIDSLIAPFMAPMVGITDVSRPEVPPPSPFDIDEWNEAIVPLALRRIVGGSLRGGGPASGPVRTRIIGLSDAQLDMMVPFGGDRKVIDLPPTQVWLEELLWAIALHDPTQAGHSPRPSPSRTGRSRLARVLRFRPRAARDNRAPSLDAASRL